MKKLFGLSIFLVLLAAVNLPFARGQMFFFQHPMVGREAPDFTLDTLEQADVNFTAYRQGRPAILFFWATWCPHCRSQIKVLNSQISTFSEQGIKVLTVDLQESPRQIKRYLEKNNLGVEVFLDDEAYVAQEYGVQGVPTFVFVDKSGLVKGVEHQLPDDYKDLLL